MKRKQHEQEAHDIFGKGWSLGKGSAKNLAYPYVAIAIASDGTRYHCGCRATREEAALLAVQGARYYGTLDWVKTVRWFKLMDYQLDGNETFEFAPKVSGRGWYVRESTSKAGTTMYIAYTGYYAKKKHHLKTVCSRKSRKMAVEHAIKAAQSQGYYDEGATVLWLERNNMPELIALAQTKRRVA
jgi:hypothetical protein